ncbi:MAG: sulfotransferase family 2 domain-containing protein [Pseudomonadota bacterium]
MMMSTQHGFAFLCVPKCASTSIESALKPYCNVVASGHPRWKHLNAAMFTKTVLFAHRQLLSKFPMESFCLVRDPMEWIESWYRFRTRPGISAPRAKDHEFFTGDLSFSEFIAEFLKTKDRKPWANVSTQSKFMRLPQGQLGIDRIFAMDDLSSVAQYLSDKIGTEITLPSKNVSPPSAIEKLEPRLFEELSLRLAKDQAIYDFVKANGLFHRQKHGPELTRRLASTA